MKYKFNLLFVAGDAVESLPALALIFRHRTLASILADGRAGPVPAVGPAEAVRAGARVVSDTEAAIFAFWLARN